MVHLTYEETLGVQTGEGKALMPLIYVYKHPVGGGKEDGEIFFPVVPMKGKEAAGTN